MSKKIFAVVLASTLAMGTVGCSVQKTEDGEAPEVSVDPGKLPEYDVNAPKVEVKADTTMVVTPDVDIKKAKPTSTRD